jgi:ubiquinone/menaquinone biosynthesis C-methylase UbiE
MANWQENTTDYKTIKLGSPSSYWSYGLNRRLNLLKKELNFTSQKILDMGCGVGTFLEKFSKLGADVFGIDVDERKIKIAKKNFPNVQVAFAEKLPFDNNYFDLVFSHEVLEHVQDDQKAVDEALRVLKQGGKLIIFCPNIHWPFETHGIYKNGKYQFGNIFGVTYYPKALYNRLTPHVRNYSNKDLLKLFENKNVRILRHTHVYPGFDGLVSKLGFVGKIIRKIFEILEKTPLHYFGISHFLIVEKK